MKLSKSKTKILIRELKINNIIKQLHMLNHNNPKTKK